ncbi:MAG TPA: hypothetical protein VN844_01315 [Pyrinomonadaceae bacterium]|nr:hypothetical protein [Pyrinomonadaceae bacterium]
MSEETQTQTQTQQRYPQGPYDLEDFSQSAINRGQQLINYYISTTDEKIVEALKQLRIVVAMLANSSQIDLGALDNAIEEVSKATKKIAGPFPPGCVKPNGLRLE